MSVIVDATWYNYLFYCQLKSINIKKLLFLPFDRLIGILNLFSIKISLIDIML